MNTKASSKNNTVGLKELRENMEVFIRRVNKGESITVYRRSTPLFKLTPIGEGEWETVIDFTEISPNGVSAKDVLKSLRSLHG